MIPIDSLTGQKRMVEAGFGVALLQESSVDEELRAGTLRVLRIAALAAAPSRQTAVALKKANAGRAW